MLVSPQGKGKAAHANAQKFPAGGTRKDLWLVVREGSLADVDAALALLKKNGGNVNSRNVFGLTPLHIATWRNHIPIVRRLLAAGADPDARDGESGWGSLHRALHFGHLSVAGVLLQNGASITLEDSKSRTPVDLLSGPVLQVLGDAGSSATEVFSWGSGANYQLGTGNAHIQKLPCKVDALHGSFIKMVSAAKFHSVAVTARGEVYTWGFGRGGRLGHPDFDIHSGQAAVITPRQLTHGLGSRRVKAIAAAKHHTVLATLAGEVFTWGSNREGQLGYTVDTQPTPRRVSSLKSKIIAVAAANKHTAVVSDSGEVFTWGCNREGQLGYGTSNSASNYTPRVVEYLKNKDFKGVAAAKYHTIVLGADGEQVYTWGHRLVTPRRVFVTRNLKRNGNVSFKFYRMERLHVAAIAAGVVHSLALTDNGTLFYWVSADPDLKCQELYALCGKSVVSISAGKYWSAAATVTGDVYMWDAKKAMDKPPVISQLHGMKRATQVSVGETHLIMIGSIYHPSSPPNVDQEKLQRKDEVEELDEDFMFNDQALATVQNEFSGEKAVPSLKALCENVAIENIVEPRNAIQMLEIAVALAADELRKYCEDIAIHNLDYILTVQSHSVASASPEILACLESLLDKRSSEPWSYRRLPTPTATLPVIINSEEEDSESEVLRTRDMHTTNKSSLIIDQRLGSFLRPNEDDTHSISKQLRALRKKLQQIEMLEKKQSDGHHLDNQQIAKLQTRSAIETALAELGFPVETLHNTKSSTSIAVDVKGSKKAEVSRKQRRKGKQKVAQIEVDDNTNLESIPEKDALHAEISHFSIKKEEEASIELSAVNQAFVEHCAHDSKKDNVEFQKGKSISPIASKKKSRKGGLSVFLSGALDEAPHDPTPPPPTPRNEGPAWGGAKPSKGFASLREIQDEQSKTNVRQATRNKDLFEPHVDDRSDRKVPLSSFLPSKPIPMEPPLHSDLDKNTPPWASGTPPLLSRPSLRDIQMQQGKKQQSLSHSPKTKTAGFAITSGQGSPSDSSGLNRWFKPEIELPSSIRSIQMEEKAIKDLKRFYSSVKIVKNPS